MSATAPPPPGQGRLDLLLERVGGVTRPARSYASPPVQLSRVRHDLPGRPHVAALTLLHLGGVLAGDRARLDVELGEGAAAQVEMAAATQVYATPSACAEHTLTLRLGAGSALAWLAQPLILFGGASFSACTHVVLAPGARLALLEVLVPGRLARGERYRFARYAAQLEVCDATGRCLVAERALLEPQRRPLAVPGLLGDTPVVGSLYLLGDTVPAERLARVAHDADEAAGAGVLPNGAGLLVRALGATGSAVRERLLGLWRMLDADSR